MQDKDRHQKLEDIRETVVENILSLCQCGFLNDRITEEEFHCVPASPQTVIYRARIHGTATNYSAQLASHIGQWTKGGTNLVIQQVVLRVNGFCTDTSTQTPENEECPLSTSPSSPTSKSSGDSNSFAFIGVASVVGVITGASITSLIAGVTCCVLRRRRARQKNAPSSPGQKYFGKCVYNFIVANHIYFNWCIPYSLFLYAE